MVNSTSSIGWVEYDWFPPFIILSFFIETHYNFAFVFIHCREFYYIQMEKYARQAISEGAKSADDLHVSGDCEIYRVLNLHYNRNNHIEVSVQSIHQDLIHHPRKCEAINFVTIACSFHQNRFLKISDL